MLVNTESLVSMTEANQNFSKVARLVDENGVAVILKNNAPKYALIDFSELEKIELSEDKKVETIAKNILARNIEAFRELAK